jgi:hypothetical protein
VDHFDQNSFLAVQPELTPGESVLWAGRPNIGVLFHKEDLLLVPFSLLWGGFAIFWEGAVAGYWGTGTPAAGTWTFGILWGIPFVLVGQYLIWGRFVYSAWKKKRTHYAVTNRRVIVVQNGWRRLMASTYLDSLPVLIKEGSNKVGNLRFSPVQPIWSNRSGWGPWDSMTIGNAPAFVDIEDVDSVYRLVSELREKTKKSSDL